MAEPFDTAAVQMADVIQRYKDGIITEAAMATALSPILATLAPEAWEQLALCAAALGRVGDLFIVNAPPPATLGLIGSSALDITNKMFYGLKTSAGWGVGVSFGAVVTSPAAENLFPNTQWQLLNGLGPGWDGNPATLSAHFDAFPTEMNWLYTGNLPAVNVTNLSVATDGSSGQNTISATCNDVQYLYPGQLIIFGPTGAHASLRVSAMRIRTVNYSTKIITFQAPRNGSPTPGAVTCSFRPVMRADMAGVTGNGPDGWTKSATALCWLDRYPRVTAGMTGSPTWVSNLRASNKRNLVIQPASDADTHFYHTLPDCTHLRGQTISFGFWVNRVSNGSAKLFVGGTNYIEGTQTVSAAGWTWMEMSYTVPDNCLELQVGIVFKTSGGDPWRIVDPMLVVGGTIGAGGYRPAMRGTIERFLVKQTPDSFHGADFSFGSVGSAGAGYGFKVDVFAETTGAIAEDVPIVRGQLEGSTPVSGATPKAIGTRNTFEAPQRYGHICHAQVTDRPTGDTGDFDINRADGTFWLYTNVSAAAWTDISMDMDSAILRL